MEIYKLTQTDLDEFGRIEAIITVNEENYVPSILTPRKRFSKLSFLCDLEPATCRLLEKDFKVSRIEISEGLF